MTMADENLRQLALILFNKLCPGIRWSETDKEVYEDAVKALIIGMREPTQNNMMLCPGKANYGKIVIAITYGQHILTHW